MATGGEYDPNETGTSPGEDNEGQDGDWGNEWPSQAAKREKQEELRIKTDEALKELKEKRKQYDADKYKPTVSRKTYERWKSQEHEEGESRTWQDNQDERRWQEEHPSQGATGGIPDVMEMKPLLKKDYKFPKPTFKTSTTKETSFADSLSGNLLTSTVDQQREEIESRTNEKFPNADFRKFFSGIDEHDRVFFKLQRSNAKKYYLSNDVTKFPEQLKQALGDTNVEINDEKYEALKGRKK